MFAEDGVTVMVARGGATTMAAVADLPSLVAVIVAVPEPTAVTTPEVFTVATLEFDVNQSTVRPGSWFSEASRVCACSGAVCPTLSERFAGETRMDATDMTDTVTVARPTSPSLCAEMIAPPADTAVTRPDELTLATCALLLLHDTPCPVSAAPFASRGWAEKVTLSPTFRVALGGEISTLATRAPVTVISARPLLPSMLAAIWTVPARRAVTSPESVTVATSVSLAAQNAARSRTVPFASRASAWNEIVEPTTIVAVVGVTTTVSTTVWDGSRLSPAQAMLSSDTRNSALLSGMAALRVLHRALSHRERGMA